MVALRSHNVLLSRLAQAPLRWICAALLIAIGAPLAADSLFDDEAARGFFATVVRSAFLSVSDVERGAFIVQNEDGSLGCRMWPATHARNAEAFRGVAPSGTVAIVHTHPVRWPQPSTQDIREAERLAIPIYVVTVRDVFRIDPHSSKPGELVRGRFWLGRPDSGYRCETPNS